MLYWFITGTLFGILLSYIYIDYKREKRAVWSIFTETQRIYQKIGKKIMEKRGL